MIFAPDDHAETQTCDLSPRWPFRVIREPAQMALQRLKPGMFAPEGPKHGKVKKHLFWFKVMDKTYKEAPY